MPCFTGNGQTLDGGPGGGEGPGGFQSGGPASGDGGLSGAEAAAGSRPKKGDNDASQADKWPSHGGWDDSDGKSQAGKSKQGANHKWQGQDGKGRKDEKAWLSKAEIKSRIDLEEADLPREPFERIAYQKALRLPTPNLIDFSF